jgi:hypothetical protein
MARYNYKYLQRYEESKTSLMLHNGLLNLMIRSTRFGHYYAPSSGACDCTDGPSVLQHPSTRKLKPTAMHQTSNLP